MKEERHWNDWGVARIYFRKIWINVLKEKKFSYIFFHTLYAMYALSLYTLPWIDSCFVNLMGFLVPTLFYVSSQLCTGSDCIHLLYTLVAGHTFSAAFCYWCRVKGYFSHEVSKKKIDYRILQVSHCLKQCFLRFCLLSALIEFTFVIVSLTLFFCEEYNLNLLSGIPR